MKRESFVHRSRGLWKLRDLFDFPIPHCSRCETQMVRFRGKWVCKEHTKVDMVRFETEFVRTVDGLRRRNVPKANTVPVGEAYPNRAMRRAGA